MDAFEKCELIDCCSMFEYLQSKNVKSYYLINPKQIQYTEIKNKHGKNIIEVNHISLMCFSLFLKLLKTRYFLSSFGSGTRTFKLLLKNNNKIDSILTQHGIVYTTQRCLKSYNSETYDKVIVSSNIESKIWQKYGRFSRKNIILNGLFRWDLLQNFIKDREKSIFLFFTWRRSFLNKDYKNSQYYKNIQSLLNNDELNDILVKNNIKLYYGIHHSLLSENKKNFQILNKNVELVEIQNISNYVRKCDMLITDYSSISFDFLFQEKPVIYYLLDENDKFLNESDSMDLRFANGQLNNLFNKCLNENEVIDFVKYYLKSGFKLENSKIKIPNEFFYLKKNIRKKFYNYMIKNW